MTRAVSFAKVLRVFAMLVERGLSPSVALRYVGGLHEPLGTAIHRTADGGDLADAFLHAFPECTTASAALIRVGERYGRLLPACRGLADQTETIAAHRGRLAGAMAYPLLVLITMTAGLVALRLVVLPRFAEIGGFASTNIGLAVDVLLIVTAAFVAALVTLRLVVARHKRLPNFLRQIGRWFPLVRAFDTHRCARVLATALSAGASLVDATRFAAAAAASAGLERGFRSATDALCRGSSIAAAFSRRELPSELRFWANLADQTGDAAQAFSAAEAVVAREFSQRLSNATRLVEPALIGVLGLGLLGLLAGVVLPLFQSLHGGML